MMSRPILVGIAVLITHFYAWGAVRIIPNSGLHEHHPAVGRIMDPVSGSVICTGFLIKTPEHEHLSGKVILTAAHCLLEQDLYFVSDDFSSKILKVLFPRKQRAVSCALDDIALAIISAVPDRSTGLFLFQEDAKASAFYGHTLKNVGYGLTGISDVNIVYVDGKERVIHNKIRSTKGTRHSEEGHIATCLSGASTGISAYGDCGSPGIMDGSVISLVSCLLAPKLKVISPDTHPELSLEDLQDEEFMDQFLLELKMDLGDEAPVLHGKACSLQLYIPFYKKWLSEALFNASQAQR